MPRVKHVKKAMKDNPVCKKGESYYWWKFMRGPKRYSKTPPRSSQLTQSDKLSRSYAATEALEDMCGEVGAYDQASLSGAVRTVAEEVRNIGEEYEESACNMEEAFPGGSPTIDECREKAEGLDNWADEIEAAADEVDAVERNEGEDDDDSEFEEDMCTPINDVACNCPV